MTQLFSILKYDFKLSYNKEYKSIQSHIAGNLPTKRAFHSSTLINTIYFATYGGISEQNVIYNDLYLFNIQSYEFTLLNKIDILECNFC